MAELATLVDQADGPTRSLVSRYVDNAIADESRRAIPASNPKCLAVRRSGPGVGLLDAAGFRLSGDAFITSDITLLRRVQDALQRASLSVCTPLLETTLPSTDAVVGLFGLPEELLSRILARVPARSLFSLRRVCRAGDQVTVCVFVHVVVRLLTRLCSSR